MIIQTHFFEDLRKNDSWSVKGMLPPILNTAVFLDGFFSDLFIALEPLVFLSL